MDLDDVVKSLFVWLFISMGIAAVTFVILGLLAGTPLTLTMYRILFWVIFFAGLALALAVDIYDKCERIYNSYHYRLDKGVAEPEAFEEALRYWNFILPPRFVCEWFRKKDTNVQS